MKALACRIAVIVLASAALAHPSPSPTATAASGQPTFRTGIELVALAVTVTDQQDRYIRGLEARDFLVYEDGVQQELAFFAADPVPVDLALLLDTSASMTDRLDLVRRAALGFAEHLRAQDRALIVAFSDTVRVLQSFSSDRAAVRAAIDRASAHGATALYNALYTTLKEFARARRAATEVRRQAIVVLTDGEDTASLVTFEDVRDLARREGVGIYAIALTSPYAAALGRGPSMYFSQARYALTTLARETGARSFAPQRIEELGGVYGAIAEELAQQYTLGYTSKNPRQDGAFRRIVVRVASRPDARLRTRSGYFAPAPTRAAASFEAPSR